MIVNNNDFVNEWVGLGQLGADTFDYLPHRCFLVARWDAHRDSCGSLCRDEIIEFERAGEVGAGRGHLPIVGETSPRGKA
ncbi:unannotated protein [freshwater metagenome]|uniref:Unannotated protein n=1 Tax=freshwater metagenome TaxID=449393 RepID=A0A6J6XSM1_9ZZZZ